MKLFREIFSIRTSAAGADARLCGFSASSHRGESFNAIPESGDSDGHFRWHGDASAEGLRENLKSISRFGLSSGNVTILSITAADVEAFKLLELLSSDLGGSDPL